MNGKRIVRVLFLVIGGSLLPAPIASSAAAPDPARDRMGPPRRAKDGPAGPFEPGVPDRVLLDSVRKLDLARLRPGESARSRRLMETYRDVVGRWARLLEPHAIPVADHPEWRRYDSGGARQGCYAALIFAFVAKVPAATDDRGDSGRAAARAHAIAGLRYLAQGHVAGHGVYLGEGADGGAAAAWGGRWQSALYAHAMGLAAWLLWEDLDDEVRLGVSRVLEYEADRFLHLPPPGGLARDTKAEENAWNAMAITVAANMLAGHPRADRWAEAARSYLYNTLSVESDRTDGTPGDEGRPVREWVNTVNVHPDFTLENHGLAHIGYMKTSLAELLSCAIPYALAERPVPRAALHHVPEVFDAISRCLAWDGAPVCFGGNDWALFHQQAADTIVFTLVSLLTGDRRAAAVEDVAAEYLRRQQTAQNGYVDVRHDLTYTSQCCVRLINAWLGHALFGAAAPTPLSAAELDREITGVKLFPHGRVIVHRTPSKFASFAWGSQRLALALPRDGNWVIWPHFSSHLGNIDHTDPSERNAKLIRFQHHASANGFDVSGTLDRNGVIQDFAFISLPDDAAIYIERLHAAPGTRTHSRETGIVGHAYGLGENERRLFGPSGSLTVQGIGGRAEVRELAGNWLNVGDRVGYAILRQSGVENVIRYHDFSRGPRWPDEPQEWISLIGDRGPRSFQPGDWAALITFLNQSSAETRAAAARAALEIKGETATCRTGATSITISFRSGDVQIASRP